MLFILSKKLLSFSRYSSFYISQRHNHSSFLWPFESRSCGRGEKKLQKIECTLFITLNTRFFISNALISQSQCCLTISLIELQVLFWCCLIHITITMLIHILYLVNLWPCLGLTLFMLYACDIFIIFSVTFIIMNHLIFLKISPVTFGWSLEWRKFSIRVLLSFRWIFKYHFFKNIEGWKLARYYKWRFL